MRQKVITLLQNAGLPDKVMHEIAATYKPAYRLVIDAEEDYSVVGSSRVGGLPDLPDDIMHPLDRNGKPMQLVIQLNLSDLKEEVFPNLPKSGILYLFNDFDDYNGKVFYYQGPLEHLERSDYHLDDIVDCSVYNGHKLSFTLTPTINQGLLQHSTDIIDNYDTVCGKLKDSLWTQESHIGGNSTSWETDHVLGAFSLHGNLTDEDQEMLRFGLHVEGTDSYPLFQSYVDKLKDDKLSKEEKARLNELIDRNNRLIAYAPTFVQNRSFYQEQLRKWHVLLSITSIDECGMCWSDNGTLTFCANEDDIKELNFSNVYCGLDCG